MTSLQKVAMGLLIVVLDADLGGFDAVPDVLGWLLALLGVRDLRRDLPEAGTLLGIGGLAAVVSLALLRPAWTEQAPESTGWLLSLPQLAFCLALCAAMARYVVVRPGAHRPDLERRYTLLRQAFVVVAVGPLLLYGAGVDVLLVPLAVLTVATNVYLVYLLFRSSRVGPPPHGRAAPEPTP